ncbi:TniQ family protein [Sulfitobacter sp. 1A16787]|uniref:TniQ family protein n=1 Tax=Sulfitobacter sp. 1A16787 TaxID=3368571 RepID=UPI0037468A28
MFNKPETQPREGIVSFVSRAAGMRGLSLSGFCNELGLSIKKLIKLDDRQIEAIAEIFDLPDQALHELLSWSPQHTPGVQVCFRGEEFVSRALINPVVRGCPTCLREDLKSCHAAPQSKMVMRGDWQLRYVEVCLRHGQPLVPLWEIASPLARYDFATHLHSIAEDIVAGGFDRPCQPVTSYDQWLDDRLSSSTDPTWLATQPTDTAARFCQLLGAEMVQAMLNEPGGGLPARALGFDCARAGPDALTQILLELASKAEGTQFSPRRAFGRLYRWLAHDMANDTRCDPYRDILREVIFQTWAVPADEPILGKSLSTPRLYSVLTAADELGRSANTTRRMLEHLGVVDPEDNRPDARLTFDAKLAQPAFARARRLVVAKKMRQRLGVSLGQFEILVDKKVLEPAVPQSVSKLQWDIADADALLGGLTKDAVTVKGPEADWLPLGVAAGRARVDIAHAINAAREGVIKVAQKDGLVGYAAIYVRQSDMNKLREKRPDHRSLGAFAREIGLHNSGALTALFNAGHLRATELFNPLTHRNGLYVTDADIAAFHAKFTTPKLLSIRENMDSRLIARKLRNAGISRFAPDSQNFGPVYLVDDVQKTFPEKGCLHLSGLPKS